MSQTTSLRVVSLRPAAEGQGRVSEPVDWLVRAQPTPSPRQKAIIGFCAFVIISFFACLIFLPNRAAVPPVEPSLATANPVPVFDIQVNDAPPEIETESGNPSDVDLKKSSETPQAFWLEVYDAPVTVPSHQDEAAHQDGLSVKQLLRQAVTYDRKGMSDKALPLYRDVLRAVVAGTAKLSVGTDIQSIRARADYLSHLRTDRDPPIF